MEYIDMLYYHLLDKGISSLFFSDNWVSVQRTATQILKRSSAPSKRVWPELQASSFARTVRANGMRQEQPDFFTKRRAGMTRLSGGAMN
ncbi:MAG: hypothetical protein R3A44_02500 [Caldilineaceae bacterium]